MNTEVMEIATLFSDVGYITYPPVYWFADAILEELSHALVA
jgi:hypothetical protein